MKKQYQKNNLFFVIFASAIFISGAGVKNASAVDMIMGGDNNSGTEDTTLTSSNNQNTLKVDQTGTGHAIHAVNHGGVNSNAVHAWSEDGSGHGIYGESQSAMISAIYGYGMRGSRWGVRCRFLLWFLSDGPWCHPHCSTGLS